MKTKTLYGLIAAAVVALIIAVVIGKSSAPHSGVAEQAKPLVAGLKEHVNDVTGLTFIGAGDKTLVTLRRDNNVWVIAEKSNYPVDMTKLREFLLKLSQSTLLEQKTSNPKRYADLGVSDIKDADAKGTLVDIAGLGQPTKIIIGNYNGGGGGGTFVRRDGDVQSWLANDNVSVPKNISDWEKRDLVDIPASRLQSVTIASGDGKTLKVSKDQPTDSNFKIADLPKGREASSDFAANSLGSVLAGLRADDVAAAKDQPPADKPTRTHYATFDGLTLDATLWQKDGKDYAQFTAAVDTAAASADIDRAQAKAKADYEAASKKPADAKPDDKTPEPPKPLAVSDPAKDRQQKLDALNTEAAALNKTFGGWTFTLATYKYADMTKSMDELLKPLDDKKPDAKTPAKTPAKPAAK